MFGLFIGKLNRMGATLFSAGGTGGGGSSTVAAVRRQFTVGEPGAPVAGTTVYVVTDDNIINDSLSITLDGMELYEGLTDRLSYNIVYTSTEATITFTQGMVDGQTYSILGQKTIL